MPIQAPLSHLQGSATRLIKSWGGPASLIRAGVKRSCYAALGAYNPTERALVAEDAVRVLIAAPITTIPDYKLDTIEFPFGSGTIYRIIKPVKGKATDGVTWIKYDCECKDGDA